MAEVSNSQAAVIDNGSFTCKLGFAGEDYPRAVFSSVVGRPKTCYIICTMVPQPDYYIGEDVSLKRGFLVVKYPVKSGIIENWDDVEKIWHHVFYNELRVYPEETPCLLTESPFNSSYNEEKTTQIMFETFNVPALKLAKTAQLALTATGRTTGIVLDIGHTVTHSVPLFEGCILPFATCRLNIGGADLTDYLASLLEACGLDGSITEITRGIKEKLCYYSPAVRDNPAEIEKPYDMPDGSRFTVSTERYMCPEALFQPSLMGKEEVGIDALLFQSIRRSCIDYRKEMYANIVLSGGSSLFPGLTERLSLQMQARAPAARVKVIAPPDRMNLTWVGGSILASLSTFPQLCITKAEYEEYGPTLIHRKG